MNRSRLLLLVFAAVCLTLSGVTSGRAEERPLEVGVLDASIESLPPDLAPDAVIVQQGRAMSLGEAVALSLKFNLDLEVERFAPLISETERDGSWGAYDPTLNADMGYDVRNTPVTSAFFGDISGNREREKGGGVGLDQLIPFLGASVGIRYEASETRTRLPVAALNDQYDSSLFLNATVPLARGLIWNEPWTRVKTSAIDYRTSQDDFQTSLMDNVQNTVDRYWELVAAAEQVGVAQKSLETARALLDQTRTQYEVGVVSRVEVVESESGVAQREFQVLDQAAQYRNAQDNLIDAVLGPELSAMTVLQLSPSEDPEAYSIRAVDVGKAVNQAFRFRPELRAADRTIERSEVNLKFAKNQRLPQFDMEVSAGYIGISGDDNPRVPPAAASPSPFAGNFSDSHDDFFKQDGFDNYSVRGVLSIPIPNTEARKAVSRNQLELRRAETRRTRLKQTIILDVRRAARVLLASGQGVEAAERARLASAEQLRAERIKLEHGESTPFDVLQRESDLVLAESAKIDALRTYRSSEIQLERSQGTILDFFDIVVDDVQEPVR